MGDYQLTRSYLESLTTAELTKLADNNGIDIPPGLERVFIIEELLELEDVDSPGQEQGIPLGDALFLEPAQIPKQYNITYIDVLIRDPLWVFAFWEIKSFDKALYEKTDDFEGYYLKIVPLTLENRHIPGQDDPFIIPVGIEDSAWYIGFPPSGGRFRVEIGVIRGGAAAVLAVSRPFRLPKPLNPPGWKGGNNSGEPLIQLSGIDELPVLRNIDRLSRMPRVAAPQGTDYE
jgi:hypothetical protein